MDFVHSTWFWLLLIVGPAFTVLTTLIRLARRETSSAFSASTSPQAWARQQQQAKPSSSETVPPATRHRS
ncbi:hypothetical protein HZU77_015090 [Neisseriaceae bacterium TC5R-5]|nr:hypothetical protein [Neisseriaceae bacterium TC5R-5]